MKIVLESKEKLYDFKKALPDVLAEITEPNFLDWHRNLRIVLQSKKKSYYFKKTLSEVPAEDAEGFAIHFSKLKGFAFQFSKIFGIMLLFLKSDFIHMTTELFFSL